MLLDPQPGVLIYLSALQALGGKVKSSELCEYGRAEIRTNAASDLFKGEEVDRQQVWMSHGDHAERLPAGFEVAAESEDVGCLVPLNRC